MTGSPAERPAEGRAYAVSFLDTTTGKHYEGRGSRIRLGSGRECEIRIERAPGLIVSPVHAELGIGTAGGLVVRDSGSGLATFLNGVRLTRPLPVRLGDLITLGEGGVTLVLEGLGTSPLMPVARRVEIVPRRAVRLVWAVLVPGLLLLGGAAYGLYWVWKGSSHS